MERPAPGSRSAVAPSAAFAAQANVDGSVYDRFADDWPGAWANAADRLAWFDRYDAVLERAEPPFEWFAGGTLNASYNCVDRHVEGGRKNQAAIRWLGTTGETRTYTYLDLYREVNALAAGLRDLGVEEDDVVTLYLPSIPELPIAMLACARLGAPHNVVFAGFSADALADRIEDAGSSYLVTCDGYYRRGGAVNQRNTADNAVLSVDHDVETVVVDHLGDDLVYVGDAHHDYGDLLAAHAGAEVEPVARAAGDMLFLIYTSGTTGEPRAVRHTTGGYLAHVAWTTHAVLDLEPADTHWCTADVGWITGHSYLVYGPLALGATTLMSAGAPDRDKSLPWEIIEQQSVDVFYTTPSVIRSFVKWGAEYPAAHDLSSLRLLATVGEPINTRTWRWYREHVGGGDCPVVDTWWQTETGGILLSTLPGVDEMHPGFVGSPLPGVEAAVVDADGDPVAPGDSGALVVTKPWPGMPLALRDDEGWAAGDPPRQVDVDGWAYVTSDVATVDGDGAVAILSRSDEIVTLADQRIGTVTLENAIVELDGVAEAAIVETPPEAGDGVYAYVTPADSERVDDLRDRVSGAVTEAVGPFARPDRVVVASELPKTRSGKVMRRYLAAIARGEEVTDTRTLRNPAVVGELRAAVDDD